MIFPHVVLGEIGDAAVWFLFQTTEGFLESHVQFVWRCWNGTGPESTLWFRVSREGRVKCSI